MNNKEKPQNFPLGETREKLKTRGSALIGVLSIRRRGTEELNGMEEAKRNTVLPAYHGLHKKKIIETEMNYKKE
jgi:hypothetical protein